VNEDTHFTFGKIARATQIGSSCGLGKTAPDPVLSTLKYFRNESDTHVKEKRCLAVAPAVHAVIGEVFGFAGEDGTKTAGKIVTALCSVSFAKVLTFHLPHTTILEEANKFPKRL
jgi:hypothetical protein